MNSCEIITLVSTLACAISESFPPEELALVASIFTQLGDSLATTLANNALKSTSC